MTSPSRRPGRPAGSRSKSRAQRRLELTRDAIAAVRRVGPEASMQQIADEAGITRPVLYDHFDGKDDLRVSVIELFGDDTVRALADSVGQTSLDPASLMRRLIAGFVEVVESDPDMYRFAMATGRTILHVIADDLSMLIGQTQRALGVDSGGAEVYAHAVVGAVLSAAEQWAAHRTMNREDFLEYLYRFAWTGLESSGIGAMTAPVDTSAMAAKVPPNRDENIGPAAADEES